MFECIMRNTDVRSTRKEGDETPAKSYCKKYSGSRQGSNSTHWAAMTKLNELYQKRIFDRIWKKKRYNYGDFPPSTQIIWGGGK